MNDLTFEEMTDFKIMKQILVQAHDPSRKVPSNVIKHFLSNTISQKGLDDMKITVKNGSGGSVIVMHGQNLNGASDIESLIKRLWMVYMDSVELSYSKAKKHIG